MNMKAVFVIAVFAVSAQIVTAETIGSSTGPPEPLGFRATMSNIDEVSNELEVPPGLFNELKESLLPLVNGLRNGTNSLEALRPLFGDVVSKFTDLLVSLGKTILATGSNIAKGKPFQSGFQEFITGLFTCVANFLESLAPFLRIMLSLPSTIITLVGGIFQLVICILTGVSGLLLP